MPCCLSGGGSERGTRAQQFNQNKASSCGSGATRGNLFSPRPRTHKSAGRLARIRCTDNDKISQPNEIMRRVRGAGAQDASVAGQDCTGKQTVSDGVATREWFDHWQVIRRKPRAKNRKVARGRAG
jgi:hypothetical protein